MTKKKRRDSVLSPAQEWAQKRNRAKGQFAFALGTIESVMDISNVLTPSEMNVLQSSRQLFELALSSWTHNNSTSKTQYVEEETT